MINFRRTTPVGTAIISAVSLKLCCWGPILLTGLAGVSGSSVYFSWLSTLRPYLLTVSFLSLGLAFYQVYKPQKEGRCPGGCDTEKKSFIKSKLYVWLVAIFVVVMTSISYLPKQFDQVTEKAIMIVEKANIESIELYIEGLSCAGCEENINYSVNQLNGIIAVKTSFKKGTTVIKFDNSRINITDIEGVIKSKGFTIKSVLVPGHVPVN
ncbi:MAG: mercury transporter [FCB group bacterium]|nr:mercury transporter [FCB group bacterium]